MKIFLAHASEDKKAAETITYSLRARGHNVFLDVNDLPPGSSYDQRIERAVKASDIFIFLISPDSIAEGRYTLSEMTIAQQRWRHASGRVLPVMVRKTSIKDIPPFLRAVAILEPTGDITAETGVAVDRMRRSSARFDYRYAIALGMLCAVAVPLYILFIALPDLNHLRLRPPLPNLYYLRLISMAFI